jgi:hypothetical protein
MAKLTIVVDIDVDSTREDPHEVAQEILRDRLADGGDMTPYCDVVPEFVGAEWTVS